MDGKEKGLELAIQFAKRGGLVPTVIQDETTKEVLILGYANQQALDKTRETGLATLWSTSRNKLWTKGEESGDYLEVRQILVDCDQDAMIYLVKKKGTGACHTKNEAGQRRGTCFYRKIDGKQLEFLEGME